MFTCYTENTNDNNNNVGQESVKNHDDPPLTPFLYSQLRAAEW
jgi:hypothetical protein